MNAFKSQQHRWAKGSIQTGAQAAADASSRSDLPFEVKREAFFHLTNNLAAPCCRRRLLPAGASLRAACGLDYLLRVDVPVLLLWPTASTCTFYLMAQREAGVSRRERLLLLPGARRHRRRHFTQQRARGGRRALRACGQVRAHAKVRRHRRREQLAADADLPPLGRGLDRRRGALRRLVRRPRRARRRARRLAGDGLLHVLTWGFGYVATLSLLQCAVWLMMLLPERACRVATVARRFAAP